MWRLSASLSLGILVCLAATTQAVAAACPGSPDAIGTSRVLVVDPAEHLRLGTMQYDFTLPLAEKEVVLTFDDGPLPPYSTRILNILNANCVKATYFIVGRMAKAYPDVLRRIQAAGHTIGTHSQNHPMALHHKARARIELEVEQGIASTVAVLGDPKKVAPFFRIPGLARSPLVEEVLADRRLMTWSADFPADDWRHISASEITKRALRRLEAKGKGILLLHDIHAATAVALPGLLKELKRRGYRIVHVVPAGPNRPKTPTYHWQWVLNPKPSDIWPMPPAFADIAHDLLPTSSPKSFGIDGATGTPVALRSARRFQRVRVRDRNGRKHTVLRVVSPWPTPVEPQREEYAAMLPAPDAGNFRQPIVEKTTLALASLPPTPKTITGISRGTAAVRRGRFADATHVPAVRIVPIAFGDANVRLIPAVHRAPAADASAAKLARLRHGLRGSHGPAPTASRALPKDWLGP